MKMIPNHATGKGEPVKKEVKQFSWFPSDNIIIAISERYDKQNKKKLIESKLDFIEIPSRANFAPSTISNSVVLKLVWHKSNLSHIK